MTSNPGIYLISPSSAADAQAVARGRERLSELGFASTLDRTALAVDQRFAGTDAQRAASVARALKQAKPVVMATRGGYGLTPLLDRIQWPLLARAVERGTRWVGHSDFTALQLGLLAHSGRNSARCINLTMQFCFLCLRNEPGGPLIIGG